MKKFLITFCFFAISILFVTAQDLLLVNGHITDIATGDGIPNHEVHITIDSVFGGGSSYYNTVLTDNNGYYNDNIQLGGVTQGMVEIGTYDCVMFYHNYFGYFNPNNLTITADFSICNDSIPSGCENFFVYTTNDFLTFVFEGFLLNPNQPLANYEWDFGDGTSGTGQFVTHTFVQAGVAFYTVCLTTTTLDSITNDTCVYTSCQDVYIGNNNNCQANYYYYNVDSIPLNYQFQDISYGNPNTWLWDFGDGTTSTEQNPLHAFPQQGMYLVCLTITDSLNNCTDTYCEVIQVIEQGDCVSYFDYTVQNLSVGFNGYTYSAYPTTYTWDFGDGNTGTGQNVTHTYSDAGYYFVSLFTEDSTGCIFESMQNILVGDSSNFSNLYGTIFAGNNLADYGFVWLMSGDSLGFNAYFDFAEIDSAGMYNFYNVPPGDYYIQAMLSWQSAYFNNYMPTYYGDVLYWEDATVIQLGDPQNPYDINLIGVISYNAGTGEINGTVTNEQSRGNVSDIEILLLSETYEPLSYINTDDEGNFDFSTLGYGTYVVYLELLGIETTPAVITISEENPSANIEIILKDGEATLSIDEPVSGYISDVSEVYPNPITSNANVEISLTKSSEIHLSIFNQMGQMVYQLSEIKSSGSHIIPVKTDNLQNGFYTLQIQTTDGAKVVKKFVKIN